MIIDTDKLRTAIEAYYAKRAEIADKIRHDCRLLTRIETAAIVDESAIANVESLWNQYFS
jgi:hypothetical protein